VSPIDQAIDAFWQCARQRTAPGPEWMKRLSREEAYRAQLGVPGRYMQAGERQAGLEGGAHLEGDADKGYGSDWTRGNAKYGLQPRPRAQAQVARPVLLRTRGISCRRSPGRRAPRGQRSHPRG
jgi:hypothetical protein